MESVRQIEALAESLGGLDVCTRLGLIFEDEQSVMSLSVAGVGPARAKASRHKKFKTSWLSVHVV
jgi:hypothetical protein